MTIKVQYIEQILGKYNPIVFFEVGANRGTDTQRFLDAFPKIQLVCFEPDPRCVAKFKKKIDDDRVVLVEAAIIDYVGEVDFHLSGGNKKGHKSERINSSSIKTPHNHLEKHPWCTFNRTIKVPCITLDKWCDQNNVFHIDWLWADVQGAEEELLIGASSILNNTKYLYTEYSDEELYKGQISKKTLMSMVPGFNVVKDFGNNILLVNKDIK